jgi:2,3-bisphosphoglycerate-independent phosphoglycerate mutase
LQASGISVGLPWGEEGNSEVGHLTMGIGKIIYQHYPRITLSIKGGDFYENKTILDTMNHAKKNKSKINFVGLISEANVHSSLEHLDALIKLADKNKVDYVIHAITDGRDSDPHSAMSLLSRLPKDKIASIGGRFYTMDRDKHWDNTEKGYKAITGESEIISRNQIEAHIKTTYEKNLNDEYVIPVLIDNKKNAVQDNDALFFFNFREDRMRQIAESFINPNFDKFKTKKIKNIFISSMTPIREDFNIPVMFPPQIIKTSLGKMLSEKGMSQVRIAETQKYAHVTFFFNGLNDKAFPNEYRILIPSRTVAKQDSDTEMMAPAITTRLVSSIEEGAFDFILANYANADMVAHTGNYEASKKAVQIVDEQIGKVMQAVMKTNSTMIITSDHGNVERLFNPVTGEPETKHDASPVPIYLVGKKYLKKQQPERVRESETLMLGMLADIAPTVLDLFGMQKDPEMTGSSLLRQLLS